MGRRLLTPQCWEVERNMSPRTVKSYRHNLKKFQNFVKTSEWSRHQVGISSGGISPWHIYPEDLFHEYYASLSGLARSTAEQLIITLKVFYKYLIERHGVLKSPLQRIYVKVPDRYPKVLSSNQSRDLLQCPTKFKTQLAKVPWTLYRDLAILDLLYGSGLRVAELIGINIDNLDLNPNKPSVRVMGKGRKERLVPLLVSSVEAIQNYRKVAPFPVSADPCPLFITTHRRRPSASAINELLNKYILATRSIRYQKGMGPHILRHSFATDLLNGGCRLEVVQALLGHDSLDSTQIYLHVADERKLQVHRQTHPRA